MWETRDFVALIVGTVIILLGLLPLIHNAGILPQYDLSLSFFPLQIASYVIAVAGAFLVYTSFVEITNSSAIGKTSFIVAIALFLGGLFATLHGYGVGPSWFGFFSSLLQPTTIHIIFLIEGAFILFSGLFMEI